VQLTMADYKARGSSVAADRRESDLRGPLNQTPLWKQPGSSGSKGFSFTGSSDIGH